MGKDHTGAGPVPGAGDAGRRPPRTVRDAEHQATEVASRLRSWAPPAGGLSSGPVPAEWRRPVESETGADLTGVDLDVHRNPRDVAGGAGTIAAFEGSTVYAGVASPLVGTVPGRDILLHELVHAAQGRAAEAAGEAGRFRGLGPLRLNNCGSAAPVVNPLDALRDGGKLSAVQATGLLDHYESLGPGDRDAVVREFHKVGTAHSGLARLLAAADPAEIETRRALVSDIQERVQRLAVQDTAGKTQAELAAVQGALMRSEAEKRALAAASAAAAAKGLPPPKAVAPADVAREHEKETKRTSRVTATVTNAWDALLPATQAVWNARAAVVIVTVVAACKAKAPELGITMANLKWAPREVAQEGSNVYAFAGNPISFGMSFVETAEADPQYAVRVVVHEIAGHPEFGDRFMSYEAQIYAEAHSKEPSLGSPWDTAEEVNTFGYLGTEIYAALREVAYEKPLSAADAVKGLVTAIDPASNVDDKIGLIRSKYAPGVGEAVLQGLYERFRIDPRLTPKALALFVTLAEKHFPKVLKK